MAGQVLFDSFVSGLGLIPSGARWWIGDRHRFPVAVTSLNTDGSGIDASQHGHALDPALKAAVTASLPKFGMLIQIRYPRRPGGDPPRQRFQWTTELDQLIADQKARVTIQDGIAWLDLYDGSNRVADGSAVRLLDDFLASLMSAGIVAEPIKCHYCHAGRQGELRFAKDRVVRICEPCLEERLSAASADRPGGADQALLAALVGGVGALVGGAIWAGIWIGYAWTVALVTGGRPAHIHVPIIVAVLLLGAAGFAVAAPPAWLISRFSACRRRVAGVIGATMTLAAVLVGEVGYCRWLTWEIGEAAPFDAALRLLPTLWWEGGIESVFKLVAAGLAAYLGAELAIGKRPKVDL